MKIVRGVTAVLLWIAVLALSAVPVSTKGFIRFVSGSTWLSRGTTVQATMLALSLVLILALSKGKLARYGFRPARASDLKQAFLYGTAAAVAVQAVVAVLWKILGHSEGHPALAGSSFVRIVITVWVIASICEETLHRGLIQSFLEPLRIHTMTVFGIQLSFPVIAAAVLFGSMHMMLLTMAADAVHVGGIVGSATVLGLVAGYYREKTGSLLPAFLVHMLFNACGSASEYIQRLVSIVISEG